MKPKATSTLLLLLLIALGGPASAAKPDKAADAALAVLATEKRAAMLKLTWGVGGGDRTASGFGAFISKEGHALVPIEALVTEQRPKVVTMEGKPLKFGTILRIFPGNNVALMKFNHRPEIITPVADKEPQIGETIALIPLHVDQARFGKIPPVVGEIMLKRKDISLNHNPPRFLDVFSFGSGLSAEQRRTVMTSMSINGEGKLVARSMGVKPYPGQTLINLLPLALAQQIGPLLMGGKGIKHPLAPAHNPFDPVVREMDFIMMQESVVRGDFAGARRHLQGLRKRFPDNLILKIQAAQMLVLDPKNPLVTLKDFPVDPTDPNQARLYLLHSSRGAVLHAQDDPKTIAEMAASLKHCPVEAPEMRSNLARVYLEKGDRERAAQLFEQAYPFMSDTISMVEDYEGLLNKLGRPKEADKVNDRFYELDSIYRRQRGQGR